MKALADWSQNFFQTIDRPADANRKAVRYDRGTWHAVRHARTFADADSGCALCAFLQSLPWGLSGDMDSPFCNLGDDMIGRFPNAFLISKFERLGMSKEEVDALLKLLSNQSGVAAGTDIVRAEEATGYTTCLLSGAACSYTRLDNGTRQIYSFLYAGDFCDLYRYVLPERDKALAVQALVDCSIATIVHSEIDLLLIKYPRLYLAFLRAAMLEVSIMRQWLSNARQGLAVQRVANLLCELLVRREAIGIASRVLPVTQIDVADAAALSTVHVNRTIKTLRKWNVLSTASHAIEVIDRNQLAKIGGFDGRYLERNGVSSGRDGVGAVSGGTPIEVRSPPPMGSRQRT